MTSLEENLKQEIMLLINERLYQKGAISRGVYEQAKVKIVKGKAPL